MALPKILSQVRNDERSDIIGRMDNSPFSSVDATTYAEALETTFILSILEKIDVPKFNSAIKSIEDENRINRGSFISTALGISTSSQIGLSLGSAYQGGLNTIKTIRRVGSNLVLINVPEEIFSSDKKTIFTASGLTYNFIGGSWSGGEELVMFLKDDVLYIANSSSVDTVG
jgi:hypothetical protein